jgi:hypothetical protein
MEYIETPVAKGHGFWSIQQPGSRASQQVKELFLRWFSHVFLNVKEE